MCKFNAQVQCTPVFNTHATWRARVSVIMMYVGQHGGTRQCSAWQDIASFPGAEEGEENEAKQWSAWQGPASVCVWSRAYGCVCLCVTYHGYVVCVRFKFVYTGGNRQLSFKLTPAS